MRARLHDPLELGPQLDLLRADPDRGCVEPRHVEQLLDEPAHPLRLLVERLLQLCGLLRREVTLGERCGQPVDRRRRRAQLVRRECDEIALKLRQPHNLLVRKGAIDRDRGPGGDDAQQLDVAGREGSR